MKITCLKHGEMTLADRLELATLLAKAGYTVRVGRERPPGKSSGAFINYVEYWEGAKNEH